MMSIISKVLFIIEYTSAHGGDRSILRTNSCRSIPVLSALHIASYVEGFVGRHSYDSVAKVSEFGLIHYCGRQSTAW
jgi:hypothetical protein